MISFNAIKAKVAKTVSLERELRKRPDFRDKSWVLFLQFQQLLSDLDQVPGDEPQAQAFVKKVKPLIEQRIQTMQQNDEFNRIAVEVHEMTELDLFVFKKRLEDEDFKVRIDAVAAAGELGYKATLPDLLALLEKEQHLWVISKLTKTIGPLGGEKVIDNLLPFLEHEDDRIRANTVEGLDKIEGDRKYPHLLKMLDDKSPRVKANTLKALRSLGGQKFVNLIKRMIASPESAVRASVLYVLATLKNSFSRDCLISLMRDRIDDIRARAFKLLENYPQLEVATAATELLTSRCPDKVRKQCLNLLQAIRSATDGELHARIDEMLRQTCNNLAQNQQGAQLQAQQATQQQIQQPQAQQATQQQIQQPSLSAADADDDLLSELAALSQPGDIAPSRIAGAAQVQKSRGQDPNATTLPGADTKKVIARLSTAMKKLTPQERSKAESLIKQGKIKNESQLAQFVKRTRDKKKR